MEEGHKTTFLFWVLISSLFQTIEINWRCNASKYLHLCSYFCRNFEPSSATNSSVNSEKDAHSSWQLKVLLRSFQAFTYLSTIIPALMALATLLNFGFSRGGRFTGQLELVLLKVMANQSLTSAGTTFVSTLLRISTWSSSSSPTTGLEVLRRLQFYGCPCCFSTPIYHWGCAITYACTYLLLYANSSDWWDEIRIDKVPWK